MILYRTAQGKDLCCQLLLENTVPGGKSVGEGKQDRLGL